MREVHQDYGNQVVVDQGARLRVVDRDDPMPMTVVHVFRSPLGGLFRHVCDLVKGQASRGLSVGILCDLTTGDEQSALVLELLKPYCKLGVHRLPIARSLTFSDAKTGFKAYQLFSRFKPDIIHGHGAKGGAIARGLAPFFRAKSIYIPHGGALHFDNSTWPGRVYMGLEKLLKGLTDGAIFESDFAREAYERKVGKLKCPSHVIYNGLRKEEFLHPDLDTDPVDFLYMGELRELKGINVLIHAAAELKKRRSFRLLIAGSGPDKDKFCELITSLDLDDEVKVIAPVYPARAAFSRARCLVLPSLAESLPYMVLEVAAAKKPLITTRVGGIPEIYGYLEDRLLPAGEAEPLTTRMLEFLESEEGAKDEAKELQAVVKRRFSYEKMVGDVISYYGRILA